MISFRKTFSKQKSCVWQILLFSFLKSFLKNLTFSVKPLRPTIYLFHYTAFSKTPNTSSMFTFIFKRISSCIEIFQAAVPVAANTLIAILKQPDPEYCVSVRGNPICNRALLLKATKACYLASLYGVEKKQQMAKQTMDAD